MEIRQYFLLFRRWMWLILVGLILGGTSAYVASIYQEQVYESTAQVFVSQPPRDELSEMGYLSGYQLIQTYIQLMLTDQVLTETGFKIDYFIDREKINVQSIRDTQLITVTVEDSDPYKAAEFANTLVQVFAEQQYLSQTSRYAESKLNLEANIEEQRQIINQNTDLLESLPDSEANPAERDRLEALLVQARDTYAKFLQSYENIRIAEAQSFSFVELVEPAKADLTPVRPRIITNTFLGAVVGLMIAGGVIFLIEYLDDTIRSPEEIPGATNFPLIGYVPEIHYSGVNGREGIYVGTNPRSPVAEAFRSLRTNIEFAGVESPLKTILVTSPGPMEGKSTVAANLAEVIAQGGKKVVVVDCDLRKPAQHRMFNLPNRRGLSELLRGKENFTDIYQKKSNSLYVITSGKLPLNPTDFLNYKGMVDFLDALSEMVDVVIIDSPPLVVTDPVLLSAKVDGVLLIVNSGQTKLYSLNKALDQFEQAGARVIGLVFNRLSRHSAYYHQYYYSNYYFKGDEELLPKSKEDNKKLKRDRVRNTKTEEPT